MTLDAAALIVGIDQYDDPLIPGLSGNVYGAKLAVHWLVGIGVPTSRIRLHLSPSADAADFAGITARPARLDEILQSLGGLSGEHGDQLFVFLCGHGLDVPGGGGGPVLLAQDYGSLVPNSRKNLRLQGLVEWAVRWPFSRQFLFYDACQSASASVGRVSLVEPQDPTVLAALPVQFSGALLECSSASPGQTAWAGTGKGVLVRHVLHAIEAATSSSLPDDAQEQDSILFDWTSGRRELDLRRLFNDIVAPAITQEAGAAGNIQNPRCVAHGLAQQTPTSPIVSLPDLPCTNLIVQFQPPPAFAAVRQVRMSIQTPARALYLPAPGTSVAARSQWIAPVSADVTVTCKIDPATGWSAPVAPQRVSLASTPVVVTFDLGPDPAKAALAPFDFHAPTPMDQFNIRTTWQDGRVAGDLSGRYDGIAAAHGLSVVPPAGITFGHHEYGPDIGFDVRRPELEKTAGDLSQAWLSAIRRTVSPSGMTAILFPPGQTPDGKVANVLFEIPSGGAAALAGFLGASQILTVTAGDVDEPLFTRSLSEIEQHPREWIEPGPYRVRIDLPWGTWSRRIIVGDDDVVTCVLTTTIGSSPLRNQWALSDGGPPIGSGRGGSLAGQIPLQVIRLADTFRIEPFSRLLLPEWVFCSRPDAWTPSRLCGCLRSPIKHPTTLRRRNGISSSWGWPIPPIIRIKSMSCDPC